jgi:hypothetical protein
MALLSKMIEPKVIDIFNLEELKSDDSEIDVVVFENRKLFFYAKL